MLAGGLEFALPRQVLPLSNVPVEETVHPFPDAGRLAHDLFHTLLGGQRLIFLFGVDLGQEQHGQKQRRQRQEGDPADAAAPVEPEPAGEEHAAVIEAHQHPGPARRLHVRIDEGQGHQGHGHQERQKHGLPGHQPPADEQGHGHHDRPHEETDEVGVVLHARRHGTWIADEGDGAGEDALDGADGHHRPAVELPPAEDADEQHSSAEGDQHVGPQLGHGEEQRHKAADDERGQDKGDWMIGQIIGRDHAEGCAQGAAEDQQPGAEEGEIGELFHSCFAPSLAMGRML